MGLRVLLDVLALLLEPFSREGAGGLRGLSLVVQGSFWGVSSERISPVRTLVGLGSSGSLGYFEVKGRVLTVMRLTSRVSLFLCLLAVIVNVSTVPSFLETVTPETLKPTRRYRKNL